MQTSSSELKTSSKTKHKPHKKHKTYETGRKTHTQMSTGFYEERDKKILDGYAQRKTLAAIGKEHNITRERVRQILQKFDLVSQNHIKHSQEEWDQLLALYHSGVKLKDALEQLGTTSGIFYSHKITQEDRNIHRMARFWSRVEFQGDCWIWTASQVNGLGRSIHPTRAPAEADYAHRIAWELSSDEVPVVLIRTCPTVLCINPAHHRNSTVSDRGKIRSRRRFTPEEAEEIRQLLASGASMSKIARDNNTSWAVIKLVRNRLGAYRERVQETP